MFELELLLVVVILEEVGDRASPDWVLVHKLEIDRGDKSVEDSQEWKAQDSVDGGATGPGAMGIAASHGIEHIQE